MLGKIKNKGQLMAILLVWMSSSCYILSYQIGFEKDFLDCEFFVSPMFFLICLTFAVGLVIAHLFQKNFEIVRLDIFILIILCILLSAYALHYRELVVLRFLVSGAIFILLTLIKKLPRWYDWFVTKSYLLFWLLIYILGISI